MSSYNETTQLVQKSKHGKSKKVKKQHDNDDNCCDDNKNKNNKRSSFPLCVADKATAPLRIFGNNVSITLPLQLNFLALTGSITGSPIVGITLQGSCSAPVTTITLDLLGVITSFSFTSVGGICTLTATAPPTAGLLSNVVISGVPLLGVTGPVESNCASLSNVCLNPLCSNTASISGRISQTLSFTGIAAPLPAALLSQISVSILNSILSTVPPACLTTTINALIAAFPAATAFLTALVALVGLALTDTLETVLLALVSFLTPTVSSTLASLAATAEAAIPINLPLDTDFKTVFSDCALGELKKCDKPCILPNSRVAFDSTTPLAVTLTPAELSSVITINWSTTCIPTSVGTFPVLLSDFLAAANIVGTNVLPAIGCVSLIAGGTCVPFSPAVTLQDNFTVCIGIGKDCCPPKTILAHQSSSFNGNNNNFNNNFNSNNGVTFGTVAGGCRTC